MNEQLEVKNLTVAYDGKAAVADAGFKLETGEIGCLLGPSGCGKTSLLRAIAGFEPAVSGEILLRGRCVTRPGTTLAPEHRNVGMVFQDFALYPHLTVSKNIGFGLRGLSRQARRQRVEELLVLVDMEGMGTKYPHQLSGGQQQRVALVRAMAPRPDILLLDEPFSGLDVELRSQLAREVREILKHDRITAILVTHDQLEAFAMADRIGVMMEGRMLQWADGYSLYHRPADRFVADFIGRGAMLTGQVIDGPRIETALGIVEANRNADLRPGETVELLLRPSDLVHDDDSPFRLEVLDRVFQGAEYLYTLRLNEETRVLCLVQSHHNHAIGERIGVKLDVGRLVTFAYNP